MSFSFNWIEYVTCGSLLAVSALIGIYYGCIKGNQNTVTEYMLGGKKMSVFPIAMSLISSHVSGLTLMGIPADVYEFGCQVNMAIVSVIFVVYVTNKCYLPVFHSLQLYSVYEYLEMRFSKTVRKSVSFIFAIFLFLYMPIVIYIPALAFYQVTGIPVHYLSPAVCFLCIFYTTIGGLKAVVWTDAIQGIFTLVAILTVITIGLKNVGGVAEVFKISSQGQRLELFNTDANPLSRITLCSVIIGYSFSWIVQLTVHPGSTQRFVAMPTMKVAKRSVVWFGVGVCIIHTLSCFLGLLIYAHYSKCDPMKANVISEVGYIFPGLTGLFLSGLISCSLSTLSAGLNTISGTLYEDFIEGFMPRGTTEATASCVMKVIAFTFGILCVLMVYVIERMGEIMQMQASLFGAPSGAIFSVFALGLFFPRANSKGTICGMIASLIFSVWLMVGANLTISQRRLIYVGKPTSIEGCAVNNIQFRNSSSFTNFQEVGGGVFLHNDVNKIYATSFMYYIPLGSIIGIAIGLLVSFLTGGNDLENLDAKLISPVARRFLPKKKYEESNINQYKPAAQDMELDQISTKY